MIKVSVKPKQAWGARNCFSLGISVGSLNHEGAALEGIVAQINRGGFTSGIIDLSDTLNRYKYMAKGFDEESATKKTSDEGRMWLERNGHILNKIKVPISIQKWNFWLSNPHYPETRELFEKLYNDSSILREAIDVDTASYYQRVGGLKNISHYLKAVSRDYYLEELSAHSLLFKQHQATSLYPGKQLECFRVIRAGLVEDAPTALQESPYARLVLHNVSRNAHEFEIRKVA